MIHIVYFKSYLTFESIVTTLIPISVSTTSSLSKFIQFLPTDFQIIHYESYTYENIGQVAIEKYHKNIAVFHGK